MTNAPKEWSSEIRSLYNPVQLLGKGGFGSVWLAELKQKKNNNDGDHAKSRSKEHDDRLSHVHPTDRVAIKVMGHSLDSPKMTSSFLKRIEGDMFQREIQVLAEMNHPHIVRFIHFFKLSSTTKERSCAPFAMILSYHKGPQLQTLLEHGGALGLPMAQVISSQLIGAVAYLHDHGVIHRDVKPDNIIITGANLQMDECWSDGSEAKEMVAKKQWNAVLIDFGFARHVLEEDEIPDNNNKAVVEGNHREGAGLTLSNHQKILNESISKKTILDLSAVGHRTYAAPEIFKTIHKSSKQSADATTSTTSSSPTSTPAQQAYPLAEYVSNYGMVADAYSVGLTIRYVVTGVPASEPDIDDYISVQNHPLFAASRNLKKLMKRPRKNDKANKTVQPRKKHFRSNDDIPKEVKMLIFGLTRIKEQDRTTVRAAKYSQWVTIEEIASC